MVDFEIASLEAFPLTRPERFREGYRGAVLIQVKMNRHFSL
jgi:hypothetical protein